MLFTPDQLNRFILQDSPVLFYYHDEQNVRTVSAPHMISMMTSMLELTELDKVLILGSKGGLIEGCIAKATKDVFIVEEHDEVAAITEEGFVKLGLTNIWVRRQCPLYGIPEEAPFNKILITGAIPFLPHVLLDQLALNGIIVMPLMLTNPNLQIILQIRKREEDLEIINYGGVIFQPLYTTESPSFNEEIDLGFNKLIQIAEDKIQPALLDHKDFFEEFTQMPRVEIQQIVFAENNQILLTIPDDQIEDSFQNLVSDNLTENISLIKRPIILYLFNPEDNIAKVQIEYLSPYAKEEELSNLITIEPQEIVEVQINLNLPLQNGSYHISWKLMDQHHYRTTHIRTHLHVIQSNNGWDFSLEFEGQIDEEDEHEQNNS